MKQNFFHKQIKLRKVLLKGVDRRGGFLIGKQWEGVPDESFGWFNFNNKKLYKWKGRSGTQNTANIRIMDRVVPMNYTSLNCLIFTRIFDFDLF